MTEKTFHRELLEAFRAAGYWAMKWPDTVTSRMQVAKDGKMRFTLPKPFDLVLCNPDGLFVAIEAKLIRAPRFKIDARFERQVQQLDEIARRDGVAWIALNFRFSRQKTGIVNRTFLIPPIETRPWISRGYVDLSDMDQYGKGFELRRKTGGWLI